MRLLITAAFVATLTASLHAQDVKVTATIPFDFHVCNRVMPPGKYVIRSVDSALLLGEEGPSGAGALRYPTPLTTPLVPRQPNSFSSDMGATTSSERFGEASPQAARNFRSSRRRKRCWRKASVMAPGQPCLH